MLEVVGEGADVRAPGQRRRQLAHRRRVQRLRDILTVDTNALVAPGTHELDAETAQQGLDGHAMRCAPGHRPVDRAAVHVGEAEPLGQSPGHGALARTGGTVDRHHCVPTRLHAAPAWPHATTSTASTPASVRQVAMKSGYEVAMHSMPSTTVGP